MVFLPDGRALVAQLNGVVRITSNTAQLPLTTTVYLSLPNVYNSGEHGLTEMVLDPDFAVNGWVYMYHSTTSNKSRVVRYTHAGNIADPGSALVIWETPEPFVSCCHAGGSMAFANDGTLLFTVGDDFDPNNSQNLSLSRGKLHRINRDGSVPLDNPYYDATPGLYDGLGRMKSIHSIGLRNPFHGGHDPVTDRFMFGDVGGNNHATAWEEVHLARQLANYGWPFCGDVGRDATGSCLDPAYDNAVVAYPHAGAGAAAIGGCFYRGSMFPPSWQGRFFFGDHARGWIKAIELDANGQFVAIHPFVDSALFGGVNAMLVSKMAVAPDGALWFIRLIDPGAGYLGSLHRIFVEPDLAPVCGAVQVTPTSGPGPLLEVEFTASASDPEGAPLDYLWVFGDGTPDVSGQAVIHTYMGPGQFTAQVLVSDGTTAVSCGTIPITVGAEPVAQILSPLNGTLFRAGDVLTFMGSATDDDPIGAANMTWSVVLNHDDHVHPEGGAVGTDQFVLSIPYSGHGYSGNVWYTVTLTVTDLDGLTDQVAVSVFPDKADLLIDSEPQGLLIVINGQPVQTPYVLDEVIGGQVLVAPAQFQLCSSDTLFSFAQWSDGAPPIHDVTIPETGATLTAQYTNAGSCSLCGQALYFDGMDDIVTLPALTLVGDFTIECWVNPGPTPSATDVICGDLVDVSLDLTGGMIRFSKGSLLLAGNVPIPSGSWTHVAISREGSTLRAFINGVEDPDVVAIPYFGPVTLTHVGRGPGSGRFKGTLDEFRIWSTARTAAEILHELDNYVDATGHPDLLACWRFDHPNGAQYLSDLGMNAVSAILGSTAQPSADDPFLFTSTAPIKWACTRPLGLQVKALLDGPFDPTTQLMRDDLRTNGLIPSIEPYSALGFALVGGAGATLDQALLTTSGPEAIVDWVLVEWRDRWDSSMVVGTTCGLIRRNGDVVDPQTGSILQVQVDQPAGYLAVRHRNHLGVMSSAPLSFQTTQLVFDLTLPSTPCLGTDARKGITAPLLLWAGNTNLDAVLKYMGANNDRDPVLSVCGGVIPTGIGSGYAIEDVNLDGRIKYHGAGNDRDIILRSIGGSNPQAERNEQLPQ
ncbi:MAG: PQQ-dependent sugar dehydrogenase [Flavobacteriales bacterium]|nr:PQQ-dependent sugar dehydrogenase [Flavobacteriales bacterium]